MGIWGQQMPGLPNEGHSSSQLCDRMKGREKRLIPHCNPQQQKAELHGTAAATANKNTVITLTLKEWKGSNLEKLKYQTGVYHSHTLQSRFDSNAIFEYGN